MILYDNKQDLERLHRKYGMIFVMSAWGFVIVIATLLFFYVGYLIDTHFGTKPTFMLGLFVLALVMTVGRFYWEAWQKRDIR